MKPTIPGDDHLEDHIITLHGMYQDYFLDYASYVILERADKGCIQADEIIRGLTAIFLIGQERRQYGLQNDP